MDVDFRPVHLKSLVEPAPNKMATMGDRKKANYFSDLLAWAEYSGVTLSPKAGELLKTDARPPLRVALVAKETGGFRDFHHAAYRARWCEGRDLSDAKVLRDLLEGASLDATEVLCRAEEPNVQDQLDRDTQTAIEQGMFGVPSMMVGDKMFWGNDRFELVRYYLEQQLTNAPQSIGANAD